MANPQHLEWLKEGVDAWNARRERDDFRPDLSEAVLMQANLRQANLREADLVRAVLEGADVRSYDIKNGRIVYSGADTNDGSAPEYTTDLSYALGLTQDRLNGMRGDRWTSIPDHLARPTHWLDEDLSRRPTDVEDAPKSELVAFRKAQIRSALHLQRGEIRLALFSLNHLIDRERIDVGRTAETVGLGAAERSALAAFFQSLAGHLKRIVDAVPDEQQAPTENDVERVASLLEEYKKELGNWPRENIKEIVDSGYRAALVGLCAGVGALFGYPLIGAGIGVGMFGGKTVGEAIGKALKSSRPDG